MTKKNGSRNKQSRGLNPAEQEVKELLGGKAKPTQAKKSVSAPAPDPKPLPEDPKKLLQELRKREAQLAERERRVAEREIEADAGFPKKNAAALAVLEFDKAALQAQVETLRSQLAEKLETEYQSEHEKRLKALQDEIDRLRKMQRELLDKEIVQARADAEKTVDASRKECERWCTEQRQAIEEQLAAAEKRASALSEQEQELERQLRSFNDDLAKRDGDLTVKERALMVERKVLDGEKADLPGQIAAAEKRGKEQASLESGRLKNQLAEARNDCERLQTRISELEEFKRSLGHKNPDQIAAQIKQLEDELSDLNAQHSKCPAPWVKDQLSAALKERDALRQDRERLTRENAEFKVKGVKWDTYAAELETMRQQKEVADRRLSALQVTMAKYEEEVNRLKSLYELPKECEARIGVIEKPYFKDGDFKRVPRRKEPSENEWLGGIISACEDADITFNPRLLFAFHTALKSSELSPLSVLAGVSGTGKSELPRLYARFGGIMFLPIAVQPNWDSPQDLFGFFNYGENRFNAKPLVQAMNQMQRDPDDRFGLQDALMLVLLDEMNLAHIELYFSDLLSALERRRGVDEVSVDIDLGSGLEKYPLPVGRNVLWCGTMNEDETTKILSDKVLDRGNLLSFPRPTELRRRRKEKMKLPPAAGLLSRDTWQSWIDDRYELTHEDISPWKTALEEINGYLGTVGKGLGHRVWQSMEMYMSHHPDVISANDEDRTEYLRTAFEDQLVMKVMPKLRGIETRGHAKSECIDKIADVVQREAPGLAKDFQQACDAGHGVFLWSSANYLENGTDT